MKQDALNLGKRYTWGLYEKRIVFLIGLYEFISTSEIMIADLALFVHM